MTSPKRYDVLESLPTYGPMYISVTDNGRPFYSDGFVVRFWKSDGTDWVANFQPGWTDLKHIFEIDGSSNLLIIACGTCYLMNPDNISPIDVFGGAYSDIFKGNNGRLVLPAQTNLTIIERDGSYWETQRISWDGLKDLKVENNKVIGLSYDPIMDADRWIPFEYDLDTKSLIGGSYYVYDNKKPWWKIW